MLVKNKVFNFEIAKYEIVDCELPDRYLWHSKNAKNIIKKWK